jgi:hypothetical protein
MSKDNVTNFKKDIKFAFYGTIDEIIEEKGSMYTAIRKTAWYSGDEKPDESKAKLEIRKWKVADGESDKDIPQKGVSFMTDDGPNNLAISLLGLGYGKTKDALLKLKERKDFKNAVEHMYDEDEDMSGEEFFDARDALLLEG